MNFWVVVTSRDHALDGFKESIVQVNHGKESPLKRMSPGDQVLFYAGKKVYGQKELCQSFVALAELTDREIFQYEVSADFKPFRRKAQYQEVEETAIRPLINELEFIRDKEKWGFIFRTGIFEINKHDFDLIKLHLHPQNE
jgi:predicted RNA-binding protein